MASITRESNGRRMIQFVDPRGKRKTLRLGKTSQRQAEAIRIRVENLVAARIAGHVMDDETARWVAGLEPVMVEKLSRVGLIEPRQSTTLAAFADRYIHSRRDLKPRSLDILRRTRDSLSEYFGDDKPLRDITKGGRERLAPSPGPRGRQEGGAVSHEYRE